MVRAVHDLVAAGPMVHDSPDATVEISDRCADAEWDGYVESHPLGTSDHLAGWKSIFRDVFGHEAIYLTARREGRVVGVLPVVSFRSRLFGRFFVSLPFLNYGGVLADDHAAAVALADRARTLASAHGARHVELRHREPRFTDLPTRSHKVAVTLTLPSSVDALWSAVDRKARNQVRKAQKEQLTAAVGGVELAREFYAVFARNMRDLGTPVYPRQLFERALERFESRSRVFVVRSGATPIAAAVTFRCRGVVLVPWASSLREHRHLCGNMLLYWTMLEHSIGAGARTFDFGRSTPGAGTHAFKAQWGGEESPLHWEYQLLGRAEPPNQGPTNPRFAPVIAAWKRLPVWLATSIGPMVVRHIP